MLDSTRRGLTEPCPTCQAPAGKLCSDDGGRYRSGHVNGLIHWQRRDLFFIDSGKRKTKAELKKYAPVPLHQPTRSKP